MTLRKLTLGAVFLVLAGCDRQDNQSIHVDVTPAPQTVYELSAEQSGAFSAYLGLSAYTMMSAATQDAQELDNRLQSFLYHPNPMSLKEAREAWRRAYSSFLRTLIFSRLPLTDPPDWHKKGIDYQQTLTLIDSWPIEGGYIDHVPGYPFSGIVNDLTLELNEENLLAQHGFSDPSYASLGFHAFEFMLWGEDGRRSARDFFPQENTAPVLIASEGGNTTETGDPIAGAESEADGAADYEAVAAGDVEIQNHNRRRQYIQLLSEQLQKHLHRLQRRWEPSNGYYATLLQRSEPVQVLTAFINATQSLLSDELLARRLNGNSSEFSNATWADIQAILNGVQELYLPAASAEAATGIAALLPPAQQESLISRWNQQFALLNSTLAQWQQEGQVSEATRQQCRERVIELMSVLKQTADALSVPLLSSH